MEGRIFKLLYVQLQQLAKSRAFKAKRFSDAAIVATYLWAALWERPTSWACEPGNWPREWRWRVLPSGSTMSRRLRTVGVLTLLEQVGAELRDLFPSGLCKWIDSKVLEVSVYSKDVDARIGHGRGFAAKGYKLHAIFDPFSRLPDAWTLAPMNRHEAAIARSLLLKMPADSAAYLLGDNAYDSNPLYDLAAEKNTRLLAPRRPSAKSLGRRRHSPHRIEGQARLANPLRVTGQRESFAQAMLKTRIGIEQSFAFLGNVPSGLHGLPNWVRHPHRVATWIAAKLLIIAAHAALTKEVT